jgi:hypothetical protein
VGRLASVTDDSRPCSSCFLLAMCGGRKTVKGTLFIAAALCPEGGGERGRKQGTAGGGGFHGGISSSAVDCHLSLSLCAGSRGTGPTWQRWQPTIEDLNSPRSDWGRRIWKWVEYVVVCGEGDAWLAGAASVAAEIGLNI